MLRPSLAPADHFISEYARGSTRGVAIAAFLAWAAATAGCVVLAWRARGRITAVAFAVAVIGLLLAAVFTTQTVAGELPAGVERTNAGRLHDIGTLLILAGLSVAAIGSLRVVRRRSHTLALLVLLITLFAIVPVLMALGLDAPGIGQRGFILVGVAFQLVFARAVSAGSGPMPRRSAA